MRAPARLVLVEGASDRQAIVVLARRLGLDLAAVGVEVVAIDTSLRRQPFHRDRPVPEVLRRFMGTTSGRKLRYAGLLADALDLDRVPQPLAAVLADAAG